MTKRDTGLLIQDMLEAIAKIRQYVAEMDFHAFQEDERTCDAVVRNRIVRFAVSTITKNLNIA